MPHELNDETLEEKNRLHSEDAWVWLYEVRMRNGLNALFLTNNSDPITFDGNTYQPANISLQEIEENQRGDLPSLAVTVDNTDRAVEAVLQHFDGLRGEAIIVTVVNAANLDDPTKAIRRKFKVHTVASDHKAAVFQLSTHPFLALSWPKFLYLRDQCRFQYKDEATCKYAGDQPSCARTFKDCAAHGNSVNFGGFPFIPRRRGAIQ